MNSDLVEDLKAKLKAGSSQYKVFDLLSDMAWHYFKNKWSINEYCDR
jgi:hypothetical protein